MEELSFAERIFGVLMFSWYFFAPEIAEIQKGKFTKTIIITVFSILFAIRLDIQYVITHYSQRATSILVVGIITVLILMKDKGIFERGKIKKIPKKTRKYILIYLHKILDWVYFSTSDQYIDEVEKRTFSFYWNNFRILFLSVLTFDHVTLKFLTPSFGVILILALTLHSILLFGRIITKHPLKIYLGTIFLPWIVFFLSGYIFEYSGVQSPLLEDPYLVWYFSLDTSDWVGSTLKFCIFFSLSLLGGLFIWTIFSIIGRIVFKFIVENLKFLLIKVPVFHRQKKKEQIRKLNLQV